MPIIDQEGDEFAATPERRQLANLQAAHAHAFKFGATISEDGSCEFRVTSIVRMTPAQAAKLEALLAAHVA